MYTPQCHQEIIRILSSAIIYTNHSTHTCARMHVNKYFIILHKHTRILFSDYHYFYRINAKNQRQQWRNLLQIEQISILVKIRGNRLGHGQGKINVDTTNTKPIRYQSWTRAYEYARQTPLSGSSPQGWPEPSLLFIKVPFSKKNIWNMSTLCFVVYFLHSCVFNVFK